MFRELADVLDIADPNLVAEEIRNGNESADTKAIIRKLRNLNFRNMIDDLLQAAFPIGNILFHIDEHRGMSKDADFRKGAMAVLAESDRVRCIATFTDILTELEGGGRRGRVKELECLIFVGWSSRIHEGSANASVCACLEQSGENTSAGRDFCNVQSGNGRFLG